jgi:hypothetical protein
MRISVSRSRRGLPSADQRQPLATRLAFVRQQQVIKLFAPRIDPTQRLVVSLVPELGRLRPNHLAHDLPRYPKLAADRLDRLLLDQIGPPDLRNRLHYQHPKTGSHVCHGSHCGPAVPGVPIGCRSPRKRGPYSMPIHISENRWMDVYRAVSYQHSSGPLCFCVDRRNYLAFTIF